jgi:hypothetical protein
MIERYAAALWGGTPADDAMVVRIANMVTAEYEARTRDIESGFAWRQWKYVLPRFLNVVG